MYYGGTDMRTQTRYHKPICAYKLKTWALDAQFRRVISYYRDETWKIL